LCHNDGGIDDLKCKGAFEEMRQNPQHPLSDRKSLKEERKYGKHSK